MIGAEAIQQTLMAFMLLASTVAVKLRQQLRMLLRDDVGLARFALEMVGIQREAVRGAPLNPPQRNS